MTIAVQTYPGAYNHIPRGSVAVPAIYGGALGGKIINPGTAALQGIGLVEVLFYDFTGPAAPYETSTTMPLQPGQSVDLPANMATDASVTALTAGHRFISYMWQPQIQPPTPVPATFPPSGPTSLLKTIPSYLYQQYADDSDLQAFVASYNTIMQEYIDWFNQIGLPVYTGPLIAGPLLDWVAQGLYGMQRPVLSSGNNADLGPYNTAAYNQIPYNTDQKVGASNVTVVTDDIFKRIMTWNLYRGDGKTFNLNWLKRRIVRFLGGPNGTSPAIDNTYAVSAFYATRYQIDILLPADPNATILKEAIDSGAVGLPLQIKFSVTIAT